MSGEEQGTVVGGDDAADRVWHAWRRGERPEAESVLADGGGAAPEVVAAVLKVDQQERWRIGQMVSAESYLERFPRIKADPECVADLIHGEFLLRERLGETP